MTHTYAIPTTKSTETDENIELTPDLKVVQVTSTSRSEIVRINYWTRYTITKINQILWYFISTIAIVILLRVVLMTLAADSTAGFTSMVYRISDLLVAPFRGVLNTVTIADITIDATALIAIVAYLGGGLILSNLIELAYPLSQSEVSIA